MLVTSFEAPFGGIVKQDSPKGDGGAHVWSRRRNRWLNVIMTRARVWRAPARAKFHSGESRASVWSWKRLPRLRIPLQRPAWRKHHPQVRGPGSCLAWPAT